MDTYTINKYRYLDSPKHDWELTATTYTSRQQALREFASITSRSGYYKVVVIFEDDNGRCERIVSKTYPENKKGGEK